MPTSITHPLIEQFWTVCVGIVLAVWFFASLIHQFRFAWWRGVIRFDFFHLLPRWTFFAPNPGRHDFHLVFRDWIDGRPGPWVELTAASDDRRWRWFWHPARYPSKALSDLVNSLYRSLQDSREAPQAVMLSGAYISLLGLVMAQPGAGPGPAQRQFAVVATQGFETGRAIEIKYLSGLHRAEP